jgi:cytochrome P450
VAGILRDTQVISKDVSKLIPADRVTAFDRMLLNLDPPEHTRLRAVIAPLFSVRSVAEMENRIQGVVEGLIAGIEEGGETDFISQFALPLPIRVVAEVIGVPTEDMPRLKLWTEALIVGLDSMRANASSRAMVAQSMREMTEYLGELIAQDQPPKGSLLEHVAEVRRRVGTPGSADTLSLCVLMILAGHETTVNLLGNGMLTLLRNPEQLARLRAAPEMIGSAIEEMLRFESPLQRGTYRITSAPYRVAGVKLEAGQQISAVIGAANRDPRELPDPDVFDIGRKPNRHLAFGKGIHKCLGERLAKAEARIAFTRLLERFPSVRLLETEPQWQEKTLFRGLQRLNLVFQS